MKKFITHLKRIGFDALALLTIVLIMVFVPIDFLPVEAKAVTFTRELGRGGLHGATRL